MQSIKCLNVGSKDKKHNCYIYVKTGVTNTNMRTFSKFAFCTPVKVNTGENVMNAIKEIIKKKDYNLTKKNHGKVFITKNVKSL